MEQYRKITELFLCAEQLRPQFHTPILLDGFVYATDTHSIVYFEDKHLPIFRENTELKEAIKNILVDENCLIQCSVKDLKRALQDIKKSAVVKVGDFMFCAKQLKRLLKVAKILKAETYNIVSYSTKNKAVLFKIQNVSVLIMPALYFKYHNSELNIELKAEPNKH